MASALTLKAQAHTEMVTVVGFYTHDQSLMAHSQLVQIYCVYHLAELASSKMVYVVISIVTQEDSILALGERYPTPNSLLLLCNGNTFLLSELSRLTYPLVVIIADITMLIYPSKKFGGGFCVLGRLKNDNRMLVMIIL